MPKIPETILEIDLNALEHNYRYLRGRLAPSTKFMAVVKAFAYGTEAVAIGRKLEELGADYLAVAYASEGQALRKAGIRLPLMVLHPQVGNLQLLIDHCLEPSLYSLRVATEFARLATEKQQKNYPVHLKFNTGLNRVGLSKNQIPDIAGLLKANPSIGLSSVFSHLAASEDMQENAFTEKQIEDYEEILQLIQKSVGKLPLRHLLNTSGILNYPRSQYDMVRSGIGLYGYGNDPAIDTQLQPVATLKTVISQIHHLSEGESVGYNRAFRPVASLKTATLPLGHADGIGRQYGRNKGFVWVQGKKAPIIGNVCMDMLMIDISGIECEEGDEVLVFGKDASAESLAAAAGTISYELVTGISQRVKRKLV